MLTRSSTGIEPIRCLAAIIRTAIAFFRVGMLKLLLGRAKVDQDQIGLDTGEVPMPLAKP